MFLFGRPQENVLFMKMTSYIDMGFHLESSTYEGNLLFYIANVKNDHCLTFNRVISEITLDTCQGSNDDPTTRMSDSNYIILL